MSPHWTRFAGVTAPHESDPLSEDGAEFLARKHSDGNWYAQPIHWRSPVDSATALASGARGDVRLALDSGRLYAVLGASAVIEGDWTALDTGGGGGGGATVQEFTFATPSSEWTCVHNLGRLPVVTVYDLDGNIRPFVPVANPDLNTTVLSPNPPLAGKVVLV